MHHYLSLRDQKRVNNTLVQHINCSRISQGREIWAGQKAPAREENRPRYKPNSQCLGSVMCEIHSSVSEWKSEVRARSDCLLTIIECVKRENEIVTKIRHIQRYTQTDTHMHTYTNTHTQMCTYQRTHANTVHMRRSMTSKTPSKRQKVGIRTKQGGAQEQTPSEITKSKATHAK